MENAKYAPSILRLVIGLLFIITGLGKLFNPDLIVSLLRDLNFPAPTFLGWVLLLSELIFGFAVLLGWRVQYTVWPLAFILLVATIFVYVPQLGQQPMAIVNVFFHLLGIAVLASIALSGPGAWALDKE